MNVAYHSDLSITVYWVQDIPECVAERLWDWGYTKETASLPLAVYASKEVIRLIDIEDDYYFLDYGGTSYLQIIREDALKFLEKYEEHTLADGIVID